MWKACASFRSVIVLVGENASVVRNQSSARQSHFDDQEDDGKEVQLGASVEVSIDAAGGKLHISYTRKKLFSLLISRNNEGKKKTSRRLQ